VFEKKTVEDIMAALEKEESAWSKETRDMLLKMSPSSLKITLEQVRQGAEKSIASCFKISIVAASSLGRHCSLTN
jgi:3-hydroxyisobutyryl-CoA hydrolase